MGLVLSVSYNIVYLRTNLPSLHTAVSSPFPSEKETRAWEGGEESGKAQRT